MTEPVPGNPVAAVAKAAGTASAGVSRAGLIGISLGVVAAGAAAGVAIERLTVGRSMRRRAREELDAAAPYGSLRGRPRTVAAPDGTELYVELDGVGWPGPEDGAPEPAAVPEPDGRGRRGWFARRRGTPAVDRAGLPGLLGGGALAGARPAPRGRPPPPGPPRPRGGCPRGRGHPGSGREPGGPP
ncbi:hypothetical protein ACFV0G_28815, partial [Kitasatospora sp. NPDC059571]